MDARPDCLHPIAQFYLPKTPDNRRKLITDAEFRQFWSGQRHPQGQATAEAWALAFRKRVFHWFLEFPEIIERGGFDCILGNPPYLGRGQMRNAVGNATCAWVQWEFVPAGLSDLVVYFLRRIYDLLRPGGFTALLTTNSIKDGDIRADGLEYLFSPQAKPPGNLVFVTNGTLWPGVANLYVSLFSLHKGPWEKRPRVLDRREVPFISALFEDYADAGKPKSLPENEDRVFQGSIYLGDGFLLTHEEATAMKAHHAQLNEVIVLVINGQELNSEPSQAPGRQIINFSDWPLEKAARFGEAFEQVEKFVKPEREKSAEPGKWWQFWRPRVDLYSRTRQLRHCFVAARVTKYLNFSALPTNYIFLDTIYVFNTDRWDLYTIVQSTIHEAWARKYSGALKKDLRYSPTDCFLTFPFPEEIWRTTNPVLASAGERCHEHRRTLMHRLWLGLPDVYNLFHTRDLTPALVAKVSGKSEEAETGYQGLRELRALHHEMDETVLAAYGWTDFALSYDFYELEYLAETDRVRYTISPDARKEVLRRLLALNHERAAAQTSETSPKKKTRRARDTDDPTNSQPEMFS